MRVLLFLDVDLTDVLDGCDFEPAPQVRAQQVHASSALSAITCFTLRMSVRFHTPNSHAGRVAQLIDEAERRGKAAMVLRARVKAETTPVAKAV